MNTKSKPEFFIVGAPKCGTTAMYHYLNQHPQVFMPARKEPHFFGSDLDFRDQPRPDASEYAALFNGASAGQLCGEASVFYLRSEKAAAEIHAYNPAAKIIIMLRNPVDMIYSFHRQRLFNTTEHIEDLAAAIAAEDDRRKGLQMPPNIGLVQGLQYRELGLYARQVERYLDIFGPKAVHVALYDDFRAGPVATFQAICRFLNISDDEPIDAKTINASKTLRWRRLGSLLWKPSPGVRKLARALLPSDKVRHRVINSISQLNRIEQPREPLDTEVRNELTAFFAEDIGKLERLLQLNLSAWLSTQKEA